MNADDDRAAYLEGEDSSVLDAEERRALDGLRELLADPAVWEDPGPGLESEIVAAISTPPGREAIGARPERLRVGRRPWLALAAAAVVVLTVAMIVFRSF